MTRPLLALCPGLVERFGHRALASLPTPVDSADRLAEEIGTGSLHVKRDDLSGETYGGNKVRKLEFLLSDAIERGADTVITFGCAGSNHALATALYAKECGLRTVAMLSPQTNSRGVRKNLRAHIVAGTELQHYPDDAAARRGAADYIRKRRAAGFPEPVIVPGGGSSGLGALGFVNAALELSAQVDAGQLPEPDIVYVALGTMGTAVGLAIGLRAAGSRAKLVAVRVVHGHIANPTRFDELAEATLKELEPCARFPVIDMPLGNVEFRDEFFGEKYGVFTEAGIEAIGIAKESADVQLEGTYTGKAFAALIADARAGRLAGKAVLFWNTYNGRPLPGADVNYKLLPAEFQGYFERPVQPLDK